MTMPSGPMHYWRENVLRLGARKPREQESEPQERRSVPQRDELPRARSLFILDQVLRLSIQARTVSLWAKVVLNPSDQISARFAVLCPADQQDQDGSGAIGHHCRDWNKAEKDAVNVVANQPHQNCPGDYQSPILQF